MFEAIRKDPTTRRRLIYWLSRRGRGFTDDAIRSNLEEAIRASCKVEKRSELDALFTLSALEPENDNRRLGVGRPWTI